MHADGKLPHILCINHSPDILNLMRNLLEEESFRVTTQSRIDKDLEAVAEIAPDVIIMDYMWARSDDEWVLLTMLKRDPATRHIPLVLCTGAVREVGGAAGASGDDERDRCAEAVRYRPSDSGGQRGAGS
jgi:CheY-like chemotaxis protein